MRSRQPRRRPYRLAATLSILAAAALLATVGLAGAAPKPLHVGTARNARLHRTILVTSKGRTLYALSAEVHGRFICTGSCLSVWKPLKLARGQRATGVAKLGAIKRPDGSRQVTFNGRPLYTFTEDHRKGDVNGEGIKDVGTWHAAVAPRAKRKSPSTPTPMTPAPEPTVPAY
jgi:predicted lipoprotein with Yx(FWY)xxD motif